MVDRAAPCVARRLVVEVQPAAADAHEDVAGAGERPVVDHLAAQHVAPPGDGRVDVAGEEVDVVEALGHGAGRGAGPV